jgi:homoaconitase/3-isopropylmalate dehydratase large subunit
VCAFLRAEDRGDDFTELIADEDAAYDVTDDIDLSTLSPLIARPSSPGNVVAVREVAGQEVSRVVIGSSANPRAARLRDRRGDAQGRQTSDAVSFDVNPSSRQALADLTRMGATFDLIAAVPASTRRGAWAASGWDRHRPAGATRCAPSRATSRVAPAPNRTRCGCARRRPRRRPRSPE